MTQDEIIRMARDAGAEATHYETWGDVYEFDMELLERFAALVASHEREKAKVVFEELEREVKAEFINAINGAVELEREACAKVADEELMNTNMLTSYPPKSSAAWNIAAAIRARSKK